MSQEMSLQRIDTLQLQVASSSLSPPAVAPPSPSPPALGASDAQQSALLPELTLSPSQLQQQSLPLLAQSICPIQFSVQQHHQQQPARLEEGSVLLQARSLQQQHPQSEAQPFSAVETDAIQHPQGAICIGMVAPFPLQIGSQNENLQVTPRQPPYFPWLPQFLSAPNVVQHVYPLALATHEAVAGDHQLFLDTLLKFHAALGTKFTIPKIGGKDLDLHVLYKEVTSRGGLEAVIKDRKWKEITAALEFPPTTTSASYVLRKYYVSLLHHYEQVYFFRIQGQVVPLPAAASTSSPVASQLADPDVDPDFSDEVESRVKKSKGIIDSAQALGVDPASSIGSIVTGAIDGKFDNGYLVTVMVGTRMMRGVLYHVPSTNHLPQNAIVPALMNNIGSELRPSDLGPLAVGRKRRRKDASRKDPNAPRQNRTGYNFFFAEQRARLRSLQPDKDRVISKMIGDLWNKLSEEGKSPYQERGMRDKERYKQEMQEYKERLKQQQNCEETINGM